MKMGPMVSSGRESGLKSVIDSSEGEGRSPLARVDDGPARKPRQHALSSLLAIWMVRVLPFGRERASPTQSQVLRAGPRPLVVLMVNRIPSGAADPGPLGKSAPGRLRDSGPARLRRDIAL